MDDEIALVKNPARVPLASQIDDPVGTAGAIPETGQETPVMASSDFQFNPQTGAYHATADGVYERQAETPADRVRIQFRKGAAVSEADAKVTKRVGPWPGEPDAADQEEAATASARQAAPPQNKMAQPPDDKSR